METDLDRDDAIGQRLRALQSWQPAHGDDDVWQRVEQRRRRTRARRISVVAAALVVATATFALVINVSGPTRQRVSVIAPTPTPAAPLVQLLAPAPLGALTVAPAGPYEAGQRVQVTAAYDSTSLPDDQGDRSIEVCYPWADGETCDPTIRARFLTSGAPAGVRYELELPGWVYTPDGLQACEKVHCRLEIERNDGTRVGGAPLDITSGPMPEVLARLNGTHRDEALLSLSLDNLEPDPSWTRWSASVSPAAVAAFPPGNMAICAFAARLLCDGVVRPDPPPFDGKPQLRTVETNRLLLTADGWIDCVKVVCAVVISRSIGVQGDGLTVGSGDETIALVPYRLPQTTAEMRRPTLTIDSIGPLRVGDTVTATLHDPPPNVEPSTRLRLAQCAATDLAVINDCGVQFDNDDMSSQTQTWTTQADGSLQRDVRIFACANPEGCYLAIQPPLKGYPEIARTERFTVAP